MENRSLSTRQCLLVKVVLFIPNVSFAIVSGKDLTMEAQRRNELQAIHLTATQRIACVIKYAGAIVRISSR